VEDGNTTEKGRRREIERQLGGEEGRRGEGRRGGGKVGRREKDSVHRRG
jgi:hypothetical protein